jgi:hypothetical protein
VTVPQGFKILGGGALIDSVDPSNFLTASFPVDQRTWFAAGKDHEISSPASITVWAFAVEDPNDIWDVQIRSGTSAALSQPMVNVALTDDYVLTGGGAFVDYRGAGNMLTASFARTTDTSDNPDWYIWEAHSKDHEILDPAHLTVYAIGIRLRGAPVNSPGVANRLFLAATTVAEDKPELLVQVQGGGVGPLTGGGAFDEYGHGAGNMLTACGPSDQTAKFWFVRGSDHRIASPAKIALWGITVDAVDTLQAERRVARRRTGEIPPLDAPYLPSLTKP